MNPVDMQTANDDGENLFADCARKATARLIEAGCNVGKNLKRDEALALYYSVRRRIISRKRRRVLISKEFNLPPVYRASFEEIALKAQTGGDLVPYQSQRLLFKPAREDALLNDFGVQHLHFDMGLKPKNRTDALLFVRITDDTLYCIDVSDHKGFTRQIILEILHTNWPESIRQFRVHGVAGEHLTDEEVRHLRSANCNTMIALRDGATYSPIGGGYVSSGANIYDIRECARLRALCRDIASRGFKEATFSVAPLR